MALFPGPQVCITTVRGCESLSALCDTASGGQCTWVRGGGGGWGSGDGWRLGMGMQMGLHRGPEAGWGQMGVCVL